jgi:hypothetical protein
MVELRIGLVLLALLSTSMLAGAGLYEQAVLDPAWPAKPGLVRPLEGGVSRKRYWVPANSVALLAMAAAIWAAWPQESAQSWALAAAACSLVVNISTISYFAPQVLRVERDGVAPNDASSLRWVALSRLRTPFAFALNLCLIMSALRLLMRE